MLLDTLAIYPTTIVFSYCSRKTLINLFDTCAKFRHVILNYHQQIEHFHLHENQWESARQICGHFLRGKRYVLLNAQPQSGKTGVCQAVCYLVRQYAKQFGITNFWFLCGMNDNNLKSQQVREFDGLIPKKQVLFSKDLESFSKRRKNIVRDDNSRKFFSNSLIILDESHFAQNGVGLRSSMVHQFLSYHVGMTLDGFDSSWRGQNIWFLSVSATPMSELAHFLQPSQPKAKVLLKPGLDYYGFEDMYQVNQINQSFDLSDPEGQRKLADALKNHYKKQISNGKYKYALIRFSNTGRGKLYREGIKNLIDFPVKYICFHSKSMTLTNINKIVNQEPDIFTVIEIYHSLRAGIQLNTKNICLVHETYTAATDVTAQGLAGRCCGYFKEEHEVDIYCNSDRLSTYVDLITTDFDPEYVPSKCTNIKQGRVDDLTDKFNPNIPMGGKMPDDLINEFLIYKEKSKNRYPKFLETFGKKIIDLEFIKNNIWDGRQLAGVTILNEKNKDKGKTNTWIKFWEPAYKALVNNKKGSYFRSGNLSDEYDDYMYIYINLKKSHPQYGWIMVTSQSRIGNQPNDYILTTGKEQFHPENNPLEDIEENLLHEFTFLKKKRQVKLA